MRGTRVALGIPVSAEDSVSELGGVRLPLSSKLIRTAMVCLLACALSGIAREPANQGFTIPQGYFLQAEHSDALDTLSDEMTIEGWFHFRALPDVGDRWMLVGKLGSYGIIAGDRGLWLDDDHATVTFYVREEQRNDGWDGVSIARTYFVDRFPVGQWLHVALQVDSSGSVHAYVDGEHQGHGALKLPMGRSRSPLFIGGVRPQRVGPHRFTAPDIYFDAREWQTVNGRVGVVRLSSAFRYPLGDFRPQRALANDRETVALWRLEEQDGAGRYQDASGNGHHLYIADGLLVPHVETLGALWSWVKMGSRP